MFKDAECKKYGNVKMIQNKKVQMWKMLKQIKNVERVNSYKQNRRRRGYTNVKNVERQTTTKGETTLKYINCKK